MLVPLLDLVRLLHGQHVLRVVRQDAVELVGQLIVEGVESTLYMVLTLLVLLLVGVLFGGLLLLDDHLLELECFILLNLILGKLKIQLIGKLTHH